MINKPIETITNADLQSLVLNQVREGSKIEYKKVLPGNSDEDKREFLADISSFANADGGDLIYGIDAKDGIPQTICGVAGIIDCEINRLENIQRDGIEPRIPGFRIMPVGNYNDGPVLLVRIPRSWVAPHMVTYKNWSRFYTRNSAGKHQMEVSEIRSAFALSESLVDKVRRFRDERIGKIIADDTAIKIMQRRRLVLHLLPLASFSKNPSPVTEDWRFFETQLRPLGGGGGKFRFNLDGFLTYDAALGGYCQLYRSGQIESVQSSFGSVDNDVFKIPHIAYERHFIEDIPEYIQVLQTLGLYGPVIVFITILGVAGAKMSVDEMRFSTPPAPIERDNLILPDIYVDDMMSLRDKKNVAKVLQPVFDAVWNACGLMRSFNYNANGEWREQ